MCPSSGDYWSLHYFCSSAFSRSPYSEGHKACGLCRQASFPWSRAVRFLHGLFVDRDPLPAATALRPRWMPPKPSSSRICGPAALEGKLPINALVPHHLLALGSPNTTWLGRAADWPARCPWRLVRSLPLVPACLSLSCAGASRRPAPRKEQFIGELKPGASAVHGGRKTHYPADGPSVDPAGSAPSLSSSTWACVPLLSGSASSNGRRALALA